MRRDNASRYSLIPRWIFLFHSGTRGERNICDEKIYITERSDGWPAPNWERENISLYQMCIVNSFGFQ